MPETNLKPTADAHEAQVRNRPVRSFVIRAGRMGSGQSRALETLAPRYLIPYAPLLESETIAGQDKTVPASSTGGLTANKARFADHWSPAHREMPLIVEIGFGMGDALASIADDDRSKRYLGIDVHPPGVGSMLQRIESQGLEHVRLIQHDAVEVLHHMIARASVAGFHIYFPDPWPKTRHHKRRLIQAPFVRLIASRLVTGGYLHCATDWEPYAQWMLEVLSADASLVNKVNGYHERPSWRPLTKFEARGLRLGHTVQDLLFLKR